MIEQLSTHAHTRRHTNCPRNFYPGRQNSIVKGLLKNLELPLLSLGPVCIIIKFCLLKRVFLYWFYCGRNWTNLQLSSMLFCRNTVAVTLTLSKFKRPTFLHLFWRCGTVHKTRNVCNQGKEVSMLGVAFFYLLYSKYFKAQTSWNLGSFISLSCRNVISHQSSFWQNCFIKKSWIVHGIHYKIILLAFWQVISLLLALLFIFI